MEEREGCWPLLFPSCVAGWPQSLCAASCLQSVVGKTSFVPRSINQYNLLPINKLLISNSSTEKKVIYKDVGKTPFLPRPGHDPPCLRLRSVPSVRQQVAWEIEVSVLWFLFFCFSLCLGNCSGVAASSGCSGIYLIVLSL